MEALKNCIFARVWRYVALGAHGWYEESVLGRICCRISKHYESSRMKAIFDRFVSKNSSVYTSLYSSILAFISSLIVKSGDRLMPLIRQSLIYKALNYIASFILRVWSGSFLGKLSSRIGFTFKRFIIVLAALYLPLDYFIRRYIPSLASVWDELFFCAVVMYILCRIFSRRQRNAPNGEKTRTTPLDIPIFLFISVSFCLMCLNSPIMSIAIDGFRATVQYMLWFYVMLRLLDDEKDCVYLEITIAVVGLMMSLHGIYQYIVAAPIPAGWVSQTEQGVRSRAFSITGSPNILGCYIVMTVPIFAGLAYRFKSYTSKVIMWAAVILECLCVLVTFSRGAWVGMVAAVLIFAVLVDRRLLGLLAFAASGAMMVPSVTNRILYLFTDDFATASAIGGRALRWEFGIATMKTNPLLGFGLGRFGGAVAMQNQILEVTDDFSYFYMDNYYLKIGTEMGYTGLIAFVILVLALVIFGLRAVIRLKRERPGYFPASVGIYSGLCGVLVHCYFENIFEVPYMMGLFWSLAAALFVLVGRSRRNTDE